MCLTNIHTLPYKSSTYTDAMLITLAEKINLMEVDLATIQSTLAQITTGNKHTAYHCQNLSITEAIPGFGCKISSTQLRIRSVDVLIVSHCSSSFSSSASYSVISALPSRSEAYWKQQIRTVNNTQGNFKHK